MLRKKLMVALMAVLVVAAIDAMATSAASAAVFTLTSVKCTGGAILNLCYENAGKEKLELEGEQSSTVLSETTKNKFVTPAAGLEIECSTVEGTGTITQKEPLKVTGAIVGTLTFSGCKIIGDAELLAKCVVKESEKTDSITGTLTSESNLQLKPTTGKPFITVTITSKSGQTCPTLVLGEHTVTGEQAITILSPGTAALTKLGEAVAKSALKFLGDTAEITGTLELGFTGLGDNVYVSKEA